MINFNFKAKKYNKIEYYHHLFQVKRVYKNGKI